MRDINYFTYTANVPYAVVKSIIHSLFKLKPKFCNFLPDPNVFLNKMPKTRELTLEQRQEIITLKKEGYSSREISKKIKIPRTTVDYTVKRHQETGENETKSRAGRPKATTRAEDNFIRVTRLCDRRLTAPNIAAQLNQCREKNVSTSTVRRRLCEAGPFAPDEGQIKSDQLSEHTAASHNSICHTACGSRICTHTR